MIKKLSTGRNFYLFIYIVITAIWLNIAYIDKFKDCLLFEPVKLDDILKQWKYV